MSMEDLLKHGPLKPEGLRGLKETEDMEPDIEDKFKVPKPKMPEQIGTRYNDDKSGQRTGWILEEDVTNTILNGVKEAKEYISPKRTESKQLTTVKELLDLIEMLRAGVMIGYPGYYGLPEWEPCRVFLEDKSDILERDEPNFEVFKRCFNILFNFNSSSNMILLLSGLLVKNMTRQNFYAITLERTKRLKLSANWPKREPEPL